ncbi:phytanoyl-CoA dioxygenase family protein [Methylocystis sp. JAN1]|uniref:phytanoyl-CoA dioxygenase family protein n=1 Tax=Methylocystis sp. JAN1 TaxID=3397211 RepID=UPI003FA24D40
MTLTADLLPGVPLVESPFFEQDVTSLPAECQAVARQLHTRGYAVVDFPDPDFLGKADAIRKRLTARFNWGDPAACPVSARVQDAWEFDADVRAIACNPTILDLLSALYGRAAFPFQTLNFPVGTQQPVHSDHIHFCSIPERFMCGVWVALEDVHADAGPLFYYPGSHVWPSYGNAHIGAKPGADAVMKFIRVQEEMPQRLGVERETFLARKGQALIWASNLLHGGSAQADRTRSRWSQVTHYFFEGCRYTTPLQNDVLGGKIKRRRVKDARKSGGLAALVGAGTRLFSRSA